jgi:hypothetical protein
MKRGQADEYGERALKRLLWAHFGTETASFPVIRRKPASAKRAQLSPESAFLYAKPLIILMLIPLTSPSDDSQVFYSTKIHAAQAFLKATGMQTPPRRALPPNDG